ncbi:MAG TPA: VWA domain-containing protein [Frankiaceae bacterium]|nr:VWA domain-containing protein [Frankiaceae bacterium]
MAIVIVVTTSPGGSPSAAPAAAAANLNPKPSPTSSCAQRPTLRIVAASGIAGAVRQVASHTCVDATVTTNDDSAAASSLLKQGKADVWIPDSRVRAILVGTALTTSAPSVAISPIVIAANSSLNTSRFSKTPLTWSAILHQSTIPGLHVEIQNNATSSAALVLASALNAIATTETGDKYLGLASTAVASETMPVAKTAAIASSTLRIEEARLVQAQPNTKIINMSGGYPQLDYPWVARSGASSTTAAAAAEVLKALQGPLGDAARKQQGLLNPGAVAVEPGDYAGTKTGMLVPVPTVASIPTLYAIADAGAAHGNTLAVLDVSGSMSDLTSPGGPTKMKAVQDSAAIAAQLLSPQTRLGLWEFTYQLDPPNDYKQLVPMAPLSSNRTTLLNALDAAEPIPTGGTSLYRTVYDAYKFEQANWNPNYANSIIVFTDGKDETDPGAPSLAAVQAQLKGIEDPAKPIQLIMLGYGAADIPAMTALTSTVGGVVYHITSPTQIVGAFIDAISHSVLHSLGQA